MNFLHKSQSKLGIIQKGIDFLIAHIDGAAATSTFFNVIFAVCNLSILNCHFSIYRPYVIKAWELMYLCASCMPPSKDFGGFLSEYVHNVAHGATIDSEVQALALQTLNALKRSIKAGPRHTIPGREEIEGLLTRKKLTTIVFFLDETFEEIAYDMTTTVVDAVEVLPSSLLILYVRSMEACKLQILIYFC